MSRRTQKNQEATRICTLAPSMVHALARRSSHAFEWLAAQERLLFVLEELVREAHDVLFSTSKALSELSERQGLHVMRCAYHGDQFHQV